jgi:hypothetical protein
MPEDLISNLTALQLQAASNPTSKMQIESIIIVFGILGFFALLIFILEKIEWREN